LTSNLQQIHDTAEKSIALNLNYLNNNLIHNTC